MSGRQRLVTSLCQEPIPIPTAPLRAMATLSPPPPAPPATPLPLSFLPTSLDFSKTKCDTAHHPQTILHTKPAGENGHSRPVSPGPQARDRKTAQQTGPLSQQQDQDCDHAASETGPLTWGRWQDSPLAGPGPDSVTPESSNWDRRQGTLKIRFPLLCRTWAARESASPLPTLDTHTQPRSTKLSPKNKPPVSTKRSPLSSTRPRS